MLAQYRYKGQYITASKAQKLSNLKGTAPYVTTSIRDSGRSKALVDAPGYLKGTTLKTTYAIEKDRQTRAVERQRRIDREKERTAEFKRAQAGLKPSPRPRRKEPEQERIIERYYPEPEDEEDEEEPFIPYEEIPDEDELLEEYFDDFIEVADIDSDHYVKA